MHEQNYCFANLRVCSNGMTPGSGSEFRDHRARREKRGRQPDKKKSPFYRASPVSRLQSHVWSFGCLARLGRRAKKKE